MQQQAANTRLTEAELFSGCMHGQTSQTAPRLPAWVNRLASDTIASGAVSGILHPLR